MATVYSSNYATSNVTYTRVKVEYSGTSATAYLLYTRTNTYSGATHQSDTFTFGGKSVYFDKTFYGQQTDAVVCSVSFTISTAGGTYSGSTGGIQWQYYYMGFEGSVTIPAQTTPPTGLAVSNLSSTDVSITGTVSITSWGTGSGTKYKELEVYTYSSSGLVEPRKYNVQYSSELSGVITVDNNSGAGSLVIRPNTQYVIGAYANNGSAYVGPTRLDTAVTKPPKAINQSVTNITETSATINWTAPADGGHYGKTYSYSLNNGSTWTTCGSISGGPDQTDRNMTYAISGLTPATAYTIKLKVVTSAGTTMCDDFPTFTTLGDKKSAQFYGSVNYSTKRIERLYCSVNNKTRFVKKIYGSVNGVTKLLKSWAN